MNVAPPPRVVESPAGVLRLSDAGATVLGWTPTGRKEVLFRHPEVRRPVAPHAGVPVCWPWFGPGTDPDAPSHGFARTATWRFTGTVSGTDTTTVTYVLTDADATSPWWPHPYSLRLDAALAEDALTVTLATTNTGPEPVVVGEALHTYLAVGDVREAVIRGLDGTPFHDKVTGEVHVQDGDLRLTDQTDRVHRSSGPVTVDDPVLGRRLRVESEGAANRVVWNPWADEAAKVDDILDAWPRFVCVEAANVLDDVVTVAPGETHTLTTRLTVEDL